MDRETFEALVDRWTNDATFRSELRADPIGTVQRAGVQLTEGELTAFQTVDWSQSDEELGERVSKSEYQYNIWF